MLNEVKHLAAQQRAIIDSPYALPPRTLEAVHVVNETNAFVGANTRFAPTTMNTLRSGEHKVRRYANAGYIRTAVMKTAHALLVCVR